MGGGEPLKIRSLDNNASYDAPVNLSILSRMMHRTRSPRMAAFLHSAMAALSSPTALAGSVAVKAVDSAPITSNVFCYGTLMSDEVVNALLGRRPVSCPAVLKH